MDQYVPQSLDRTFIRREVDIVFVLDCTQPMNVHVHEVSTVLRRIIRRLLWRFDVNHACVQYHGCTPSANAGYSLIHSNFTRDLPGVTVPMNCQGLNTPDAMADGLYSASNLQFRSNAIKICVWIGDANLQGLAPMEELPQPRPDHHDLVEVCHQMAASGIVLLCFGCNQTSEHVRAFFMGLSLITGGRFIAVQYIHCLSQIVARLVREEVENERFVSHAADAIAITRRANPNATVDEIARYLNQTVNLGNPRVRTVRYNQRNFAGRICARYISTANTLPEAFSELRKHIRVERMVEEIEPAISELSKHILVERIVEEIAPVLYVYLSVIIRAMARSAVQKPIAMPMEVN
ncbi:uncharacterized protein LOC114515628 [Dendronephthya gigantea]|uniref:uncharacterized protein LOC114515628 n=1 Tax=Dendronephthya gigantea TaxID=151771 RepID=UPI0010692C47|nr:uncharacterized protein LOC114515628 [Dendronephthya gigantea]